jgi:hypothetical protein
MEKKENFCYAKSEVIVTTLNANATWNHRRRVKW